MRSHAAHDFEAVVHRWRSASTGLCSSSIVGMPTAAVTLATEIDRVITASGAVSYASNDTAPPKTSFWAGYGQMVCTTNQNAALDCRPS